MKKTLLYVGLDVHEKTIDIAIGEDRKNGAVRYYSRIEGTLEALDKLL
jgi:hypothetical protein